MSSSTSSAVFLTKFETKSNRVKGLSFHPKRPWIVASLHNGVIQLWDYRMGTLLDRFDEHDGPVRGVNFHRSQPLIVSGGDDYKIKVWNYKLRRCMFTLMGHLDYIRTVQFHHELPWIVSSSDDQTVRIWNWVSRSCIAVLTGHNHYVMSAMFHFRDDLVVSASLDQTIRVWDISGLRKKSESESEQKVSVGSELFGSSDATVKYLLEGHDRGVNFAAFHPTLPLIVSGADDRLIKLWRMNEVKSWEVDTLRGHVNNVSCVMFHPKHELIISNSEDRSIRVWDMSKRCGVQTFRRENDRFWMLAVHPEQNLLAAGHDSGMIVFKLERERPAHCVIGNRLYYIRDRFLRMAEFDTGRDVPLLSIRRPSLSSNAIRSMQYNPGENCLLINTDVDGGSYELYQMPKDSGANQDAEPSRGLGVWAVFVARNRFAVLDRTRVILIKNFKNEVVKKFTPWSVTVESLFPAGTGMLLARNEDCVALIDLQQRKPLNTIATPAIKYVVWSPDMKYVAFLSKHAIILATRKLEHICTVHETIRVKSGCWDEKGFFVYSTLNHIKFCLLTGDSGIIRTLEQPVYLTAITGNKIHCLDREGGTRVLMLDMTECLFKLALCNRQLDEVFRVIQRSRLCGQAIIAYLQKKGFPEIALHFVKHPKTRFNLALECGNIQLALESANEGLKDGEDDDCWRKLGSEALWQGNFKVVESVYQRIKDFERLSMLYLITGNVERLRKMLKIACARNDIMSRFHNALFLGNVEERIKILQDAGLHSLAYILAANHGLTEEQERIAAALGDDVPVLPPNSRLLFPPNAISPFLFPECESWPLLAVSRGFFDAGGLSEKLLHNNVLDEGNAAKAWGGGLDDDVDDKEAGGGGGGWGDDEDLLGGNKPDEEGMEGMDDGDAAGGGGGGGWGDDDLDLDLGDVKVSQVAMAVGEFFAPTAGQTPGLKFSASSVLAAEHIAAGSFDSAMQLLNRQCGVVNFAPLKPLFMAIYTAANGSMLGMPSVPAMKVPLYRNWQSSEWTATTAGSPSIPFNIDVLSEQIKVGYKHFTDGKLPEAQAVFESIMYKIPLVVVDTRADVEKVHKLLHETREYLSAIIIELARRNDFKDDAKRSAELAAYLTHLNLQPLHLLFLLRSAMTVSFKLKNFQMASSFCRRLLELNPKREIQEQVLRVLKACEGNPINEVDVDYDERNPFVTDCIQFKPVYRGRPIIRCTLCLAPYEPAAQTTDKLCPVCKLGKISSTAANVTMRSAPQQIV